MLNDLTQDLLVIILSIGIRVLLKKLSCTPTHHACHIEMQLDFVDISFPFLVFLYHFYYLSQELGVSTILILAVVFIFFYCTPIFYFSSLKFCSFKTIIGYLPLHSNLLSFVPQIL